MTHSLTEAIAEAIWSRRFPSADHGQWSLGLRQAERHKAGSIWLALKDAEAAVEVVERWTVPEAGQINHALGERLYAGEDVKAWEPPEP